MVRAKKDAATAAAAKAEEVAVDVAPVLAEAGEAKKAAGRGKRKGKDTASGGSSPPKRTLRSNSSKAALVEPEKPVEEKKVRKAPAKSKKAAEAANGIAEEENKEDSPVANGKANGRQDINEPSKTTVEKNETEKAQTSTKGRKGKKTEAVDKEATEANGNTDDSEKTKPVKSGRGRPKKAAAESQVAEENEEADVEQAQSEPVAKPSVEPEPEARSEANGNTTDEENPKEKEKTASGKGKKKTSKDDETVAPKKSKKDGPALKLKPIKAAASEESSGAADDKEGKTATTEAKKGKGAVKVKEIALEHWNAERIKSILEKFCTPSVVFSINKKAPRRGSFEITVIRENAEDLIIWSGIKRGPPRKEKFPSDDQIQELAEKFISSSSSC